MATQHHGPYIPWARVLEELGGGAPSFVSHLQKRRLCLKLEGERWLTAVLPFGVKQLAIQPFNSLSCRIRALCRSCCCGWIVINLLLLQYQTGEYLGWCHHVLQGGFW